MKKKLAIFASGNGSNFEALAQACKEGRINAEVALCVTDKPGAYVEQRAARFDVDMLSLKPKDFSSKEDYEKAILKVLEEKGIDLICLAGYMRIVGKVLLDAYRGRILNIHPSLLPSFPGVDAIGQAMAYGVKVYGVTIHHVDETLDGGKIIAQASIAYYGHDREELEPLLHGIEHKLYVDTVSALIEGREPKGIKSN